MGRRSEYAKLLPGIVRNASNGEPIHIADIYGAVQRELPHLVDSEVESSGAIRWKHELRWELETLVINGVVLRRKDLGLGMYTVPAGDLADEAVDLSQTVLARPTANDQNADTHSSDEDSTTELGVGAIAVGSWGAGFGTAEHNRLVEHAAMHATTEHYSDWNPIDVSETKCGWDITFTKPESRDLHVEVKGVSGSAPVFLLTANELETSLNDPDWKLAVVTRALVAPLVTIYPATTVRAAARPTVYRVSLLLERLRDSLFEGSP